MGVRHPDGPGLDHLGDGGPGQPARVDAYFFAELPQRTVQRLHG
jgi:hypothetical protein